MKKIAVFFIILIIIVASIFYMYSNYKTNVMKAKRENLKFEMYNNQEVEGIELATLINRTIDSNEKNRCSKRQTRKIYR